MNVARVCEGGLVRIPAEILSVLGLKLGDKVSFVQNQNGNVVLSSDKERICEEGLAAFLELREQAADVPEMSLEEINAEIRAAREDMRKRRCNITR